MGPLGEGTEQDVGSAALREHMALGDAAAAALGLAALSSACPGCAGVGFPGVSFLGGGAAGTQVAEAR